MPSSACTASDQALYQSKIIVTISSGRQSATAGPGGNNHEISCPPWSERGSAEVVTFRHPRMAETPVLVVGEDDMVAP